MECIWIVHQQNALSDLKELRHDLDGHCLCEVPLPWWHHQMELFSALLALCAGNSPATGEFPAQRPVRQSFDVFYDLHLNKRFSEESRGWWFESPSRSYDVIVMPSHRAMLSISSNGDTISPNRTFWVTIYDCSTHSSLWYHHIMTS